MSPVWVFVTRPTLFERLLRIVRERRSYGRLFYRVPNEGHALNPQLLQLLLGPGYKLPGFNVTEHLVFQAQAGQILESDPKHTGPPIFQTPQILLPRGPDVNINVDNSLVYGVAVDSLTGEFLLHLYDQPEPGLFFY